MLQADAKMGRLNIITTMEMQTMTVSTKNSLLLVVDLLVFGMEYRKFSL
jgi:hypothetical protein